MLAFYIALGFAINVLSIWFRSRNDFPTILKESQMCWALVDWFTFNLWSNWSHQLRFGEVIVEVRSSDPVLHHTVGQTVLSKPEGVYDALDVVCRACKVFISEYKSLKTVWRLTSTLSSDLPFLVSSLTPRMNLIADLSTHFLMLSVEKERLKQNDCRTCSWYTDKHGQWSTSSR